MNDDAATKVGKDYIGYEYKTVTVDKEKVSMYLDAYENFGWAVDDAAGRPIAGLRPASGTPATRFVSAADVKLKRDRKILNKAELTRLQQHFEACMDEIANLEDSKTKMATVYSIAAGVAGTVFMAGSVFAVTAEPPAVWLCVSLGVPGLIGWALPYYLYKFFTEKRTREIAPLIEQKYDEIHEICEKGNALLH